MRTPERPAQLIKELQERLAFMDAAKFSEAESCLRSTAGILPQMSAEDLDDLKRSLESLRRALTFARDIYSKRLEALSEPGTAYTTAGSEQRSSEPIFRMSA